LILYFVTGREAYTVENYLRERGSVWRDRIKTVTYESLPQLRSLPTATYIFSDLDRLTKVQRLLVQNLYEKLSKSRPDLRLLNEPAQFVGRYDLLNRLYEAGTNKFRAYRSYELGGEVRYPVFLRLERDHLGPRSGLISNREELDQAVTEALMAGVWPSNLMIVEFCDVSDAQGVYRKYSVFRIGDHYMARHMVLGKDWFQKVPRLKQGTTWPMEWLNEEKRFLESNPHLNQVRQVFDLAKIDYGRIDYGILDGKIQVWEINSNPTCMTPIGEQIPQRVAFDEFIASRFHEAWPMIDCKLSPDSPVESSISHAILDSALANDWATG
jgi:hypothetical protein